MNILDPRLEQESRAASAEQIDWIRNFGLPRVKVGHLLPCPNLLVTHLACLPNLVFCSHQPLLDDLSADLSCSESVSEMISSFRIRVACEDRICLCYGYGYGRTQARMGRVYRHVQVMLDCIYSAYSHGTVKETR